MSAFRRAATTAAAVLLVAAATATAAAAAAPAARTPLPPIATWNAKSVPVPANDVAWDATRGVLLATLAGTNASLGNELVEIDPSTGAVGRHVFVGSEPTAVTVTDDGSTAYVGLAGANRVTEVDLATFTVVRSFSLGVDPFSGPRFAEDVEALPGRNDVVAVSTMNHNFSPRHEGVFVFRNGVARTNATDDHTGANRIEFGDDPGTLYGYNNETTGFGFYTIGVDSTGVWVADVTGGLVSGFGVDIEHTAGRVYSTNGKVVDPVAQQVVGTFPASGAIEVTPDESRITFLSGATVSRYDLVSGALAESRTFAGLAGTPRALVATGTGFAAATGAALHLLGPAVAGGRVELPDPPASTIADLAVLDVPMAVAGAVVAPDGRTVYASVTGTGALANTVVAVDVLTGEVLDDVAVGSAPGTLALSDGGTTLHVSLTGTNVVEVVDVESFTVVREVALGGDLAEDVEVQPGTDDVVAVSLRNACCSPRHEGVAVFDPTGPRPERTPGHTGANRIEFADADTIYGYNNETTGFGFYELAVDGDGVRIVRGVARVLYGFGLDIELAGDLVYATNGQVVEPVAAEPAGTFAASGVLEAVPDAGRAYFLSGASLREHDLERFRPVASRTLPIAGPSRGLERTAIGLTAWTDGHLYLLNPPTCAGVEATIAAQGGVAVGTEGADVIVGGAGPDRIDGNGGNDLICGHGGADSIDGGGGDDTVLGGAGDDEMTGGTGGDDVDGEDGVDTVLVGAGTARRVVDLDDVADDGAAGEGDNVRSTNEVVVGGDGPDLLTGNGGGQTLDGAGGDDVVRGGGGDDALLGGGGADALAGGSGADRLTGGDGGDDLDGGTGVDTVLVGDDAGSHVVDLDDVADDGLAGEGDNVRSTNEVVVGGPGPDVLTGNDARQTLDGAGGDDDLSGLGGADVLLGGEGGDDLDGGAGDDLVDGGAGGDDLDGGDGFDTVALGSDAVAHTVDLDDVADDGAEGEGDNVRSTIEAVVGSPGPDTITGTDGAERFDVGDGDDSVDGGGGADTVTGRDGADLLVGGSGDDVLDGGAGRDVCQGGEGADTGIRCERFEEGGLRSPA